MPLTNNCSPRLITVDNSCGCTLTRASITAMTSDIFESIGNLEVGMDRLLLQRKEALIAGVQQRSLMDLMLSRTVPIKTTTITPNGGSVIAPFFLVPQDNVVNANYFVVSAGIADPNAGVGSIPLSAWDVTVRNDSSQFASALVDLEKFFLPGRFINIAYKTAITGVAQTVQFMVLSSAALGVGTCTLVLVPPYTAAGWAALNAGQKAIYQPTHGVLIPLSNSVSNYESWCYNGPSVNAMKFLEYWLQTIRTTFCYNDEYLKALNADLTGGYFRRFRTLPLAKQRAQQEAEAERAYFNTLFYGSRINEMQTQNTYQSLPQVTDPANPSCLLEYKSNTLGFKTQLQACSRVIDNQGAVLDLDTLKSLGYAVMRNRESQGGIGGNERPRLDCLVDRNLADMILTIMIQYYQTKYGVQYVKYFTANEVIKQDNIVLWNYNVYQFPDEGFELCVISERFFDDRLATFTAANAGVDATIGRELWMVDWSDAQIGLAGTASATRQTNVADNLYNCVITPNVNHYQLASKTVAAMIQRPNRHLIISNIGSGCPNITANPCTPNS